MILTSYQQEGIAWLATKRRGILVCPAGGGKSLLLAAALARVLAAKPRTAKVRAGWLCNTIEQKQQAEDALAVYPEIALLADVTIACGAAGKDWSAMDILIIDECHHIGSESWGQQVRTCKGAAWATTATPEVGDYVRDAALVKLFDGNLFEIKRDEVMDSGRLVPGRVVMLNETDACGAAIDYEEAALYLKLRRFSKMDDDTLRKNTKWMAIASIGISANVARNDAVVINASYHAKKMDSVLVLVNAKEHGEVLAQRIGNGALMVHSGLGKKKRAQAIADFRSGALRCMCATSLADEGLDIPRANVLILASGGQSRVKTIQRTGRVMRAFPGKTEGLVYDFEDTAHRTMRRHAENRMSIYRELGYKVTFG